MHNKKDRPLVVVIERRPEGLTGTLIATQIRHMTFMEWCKYKLCQRLCKGHIPVKPPTGFPSISVGVWIDSSQYNKLLNKDTDGLNIPMRTIPKEMVLMSPVELTTPDNDEGYAV